MTTLGVICLVCGAFAGYLIGTSQVKNQFENKVQARERFKRVMENEGMETAVRKYVDDQL